MCHKNRLSWNIKLFQAPIIICLIYYKTLENNVTKNNISFFQIRYTKLFVYLSTKYNSYKKKHPVVTNRTFNKN